MAGVGVAGTRQQGPRSGGGSLHQQCGHGPGAGLPGGPQRQEHGDCVEEGRVLLSFRECMTKPEVHHVATEQVRGQSTR